MPPSPRSTLQSISVVFLCHDGTGLIGSHRKAMTTPATASSLDTAIPERPASVELIPVLTPNASNPSTPSTLNAISRPPGMCDLLIGVERVHATRTEAMRAELLAANRLLTMQNSQLTAQMREFSCRERHLVDVLKTVESKRERMETFHSANTRELITDFEMRMGKLRAELEGAKQRERIKEEAMNKTLEAKEARIKQLEEAVNASISSGNSPIAESSCSARLQLTRGRIEKEVRQEEGSRRKRALADERQQHDIEMKRLREQHERKEESLTAEWRARLDRAEARENERKEKELALQRCSSCAKRVPNEDMYTCLDESCLIVGRASASHGDKWATRTYCPSCVLDSHRAHSSVPQSHIATEAEVKDALAKVEQIRGEVNSSLVAPYATYKELLLNEAIAEKNTAIDFTATRLLNGRPLLRTTLLAELNKVQAVRDDFAKFLSEDFALMLGQLKERIRLDQGASLFGASNPS